MKGTSRHLQQVFNLAFIALSTIATITQARTAFEKMTDVDYQGETYYTIRNLSLYECQGWCREEVECQAASFSFVANSQGQQETVCLLQNGTQANNPTAKPIRALNQYYMVKMSIRSDQVCKRPWNFERVPNSIIQGHDRALIFTSTKEACLAACLNERNFVCRSAEYNYVTLQCRLSDYDRRTLEENNVQAVTLVEAQGVDYFENLCLSNDNACEKDRSYQIPQFGVPSQKVSAHIKTQFYVDKELMANSVSACSRACSVESEFLCRSFLYLGPPTGTDYNCRLYHMDHWSLPNGINTFLQSNLPLAISNGNRIGVYYENRCAPIDIDSNGEGRISDSVDEFKRPKAAFIRGNRQSTSGLQEDEDDSMLCKTVITRDRRYITQITCYEKGSEAASEAANAVKGGNNGGPSSAVVASRLPTYGKQTNGGALASLFNFPSRRSGNFNGGRGGSSGGGQSMPRNRQQQQLLLTGQLSVDNGGEIDNDLGIGGGLSNTQGQSGTGNNRPSGSNRPSNGGVGSGGNGINNNNIGGGGLFDPNGNIDNGVNGVNGVNVVNGGGGQSNIGGVGNQNNQENIASSGVASGISGQAGPSGTVIGDGGSTNGPAFGTSNNNNLPSFGGNNDFDDPDINCDPLGTCYDVSVHCKDTRIVVNVNTNKAFSGRIYALGRSETCNVDVINSDSFRLDLTMSGQDCNTQSVAGVYTNTVVVQRHSVVMTKTDKIYKVRCTYDTTSRNITFGMMPIRDPDMISITSAPEAPAPRIRILDSRGSEVETVRIGDRLTFRIEIPDKTPYGIFARSCLAMAKDARSTFEIIDDNGCPVDPGIFPRFTPEGNALVSTYEAFRFTESYGVIFQCNVKYCLGPCQPVTCNFGRDTFESWGKRKKREVNLPANVIDTGEDVDAQMRLSHEIVVLDFGDEQTNPFDFEKSTSGNRTDYKVSPMDWDEDVSAERANIQDDCPERSSVMGLAVACAVLVVSYVCTVLCMCVRRANSGSTKVVLPPEHRPGMMHSASVSLAGSTNSFGLMAHDYVR